jgi:hypothetical protein
LEDKYSSSELKEHESNINAASRLFHLNLLSSATAVCVDGSKSSFWSNNRFAKIFKVGK